MTAMLNSTASARNTAMMARTAVLSFSSALCSSAKGSAISSRRPTFRDELAELRHRRGRQDLALVVALEQVPTPGGLTRITLPRTLAGLR